MLPISRVSSLNLLLSAATGSRAASSAASSLQFFVQHFPRSSTETQANLIVSRAPTNGNIGRVSVKWRIEQVDSMGVVMTSLVADVTPTEGSVVMEDGESETVRVRVLIVE